MAIKNDGVVKNFIRSSQMAMEISVDFEKFDIRGVGFWQLLDYT